MPGKSVPAGIRGLGALIRPDLVIAAGKIEVPAVRPGMAEHPVQDHPDPQGPGLLAKRFKVLQGTEGRVHHVIPGVVLVVGAGPEDGVQVGSDAKVFR